MPDVATLIQKLKIESKVTRMTAFFIAENSNTSIKPAKFKAVTAAVPCCGEAPIFPVADCGLQADLFAAVPELTAAL